MVDIDGCLGAGDSTELLAVVIFRSLRRKQNGKERRGRAKASFLELRTHVRHFRLRGMTDMGL
jgi:hypothetical protein